MKDLNDALRNLSPPRVSPELIRAVLRTCELLIERAPSEETREYIRVERNEFLDDLTGKLGK